ncbi:hypothetical protein, partial [uncultured Dialister sp.]|uniref:hypothetical protein n=1 Tax=uncultured Dialister sp. TaxID=278064 RepID=UPI0025E4E1F7
GTMITGIFVFHYNTIIPLKKVSDSFELDTFLETVLIQLFHSPGDRVSGGRVPGWMGHKVEWRLRRRWDAAELLVLCKP